MENHTPIQWYHFGPARVTHNKGSGLQFEETVYISEFNGARKVISNAYVATNKNSEPCRTIFLRGDWGGQCLQLKFFQTSEIVRNDSS